MIGYGTGKDYFEITAILNVVELNIYNVIKLDYLSIRHACAETNCCGSWFAGFRDDKQIFPNKMT